MLEWGSGPPLNTNDDSGDTCTKRRTNKSVDAEHVSAGWRQCRDANSQRPQYRSLPAGGVQFNMDGEFGKRGLPKLRELLRRPRGESEVNS